LVNYVEQNHLEYLAAVLEKWKYGILPEQAPVCEALIRDSPTVSADQSINDYVMLNSGFMIAFFDDNASLGFPCYWYEKNFPITS
jgi:hypothetical protein